MAELYLFADSVELCRLLLEGGGKMIQYRAKGRDPETAVREAESMLRLVRRYPGARLIINDSWRIASAVGADGVHLGQDDGDLARVRSRLPEGALIGVSVDTPAEAVAAAKAGADYIAAGALYYTPTKPDAVVIGWEGVTAVRRSIDLPLAVIGGIGPGDIPRLVTAGADYICMIAGVNTAADIPARIRELRGIIAGGLV